MQRHDLYMSRCIDLAQRAYNQAAPNPLVGAVLVYQDRVIGAGYHQEYGQAHAEVNAILSVSPEEQHLIREATLYVSLEPCSFYGNTPACTSLIIQKNIPKVVVGCIDPHNKVAGKGIALLRQKGIEVITGILEQECIALNKKAFTSYQLNRPYIFLKWAETQNGLFAPLDRSRKMISGIHARLQVHDWRRNYHSILVGYNTALHDNPELTNRYWFGGNQPIRIVLDPKNQLPEDLHLFNHQVPTYSIIDDSASPKDKNVFKVNYLEPNWVQQLLDQLYQAKIQSVMVEGGIHVLNSFIEADLWDEIAQIVAPQVWSEGLEAPQIKNGQLLHRYPLKEDFVNLWKHERNNYLL